MRAALVLVVLMLLIVCPMAMAQYEGDGKTFSLSAGLYRPINSNMREVVGSNWLNGNIAYKLSSTDSVDQVIQVGLITKNGPTLPLSTLGLTDTGTFNLKPRIIPVTYTYLAKPRSDTSRIYYGVGVGAYFCKTKMTGATGGEIPTPFSLENSDTIAGAHALAGIQLSDTISAELRYTHLFGDLEVSDAQSPLFKESLDGVSLNIIGVF